MVSVVLIGDSVPILLSQFKQQRLVRFSWVIDESNRMIRMAVKGRLFIGRVLRNLMLRKIGPPNVGGWRKLLLWDEPDHK
ncbi:MAG: hypothetical protein ACI9FJ_000553 [Alteromonadaceae bacterium]